MEAAAHDNNVIPFSLTKQRPNPSSTDELSIAEIKESIGHVRAQNELIAEQNRKILDSLESLNKKVYETTTTTTVALSETIAQPKIDRLSGPVQFFLKLIELWGLEEKDACKLLGYELTEIKYVADVLSGVSPLLGRDIKDRIANLFVIRKRLAGLFNNIDVENEWLRGKQADLNSKSPLELLLSGSMENILLIKEFVEHISGL
jgi:hypothetical protein